MIAPWTELKCKPLRARAAPRDLMPSPYPMGARVVVHGLNPKTELLGGGEVKNPEWRILRRVTGYYPNLENNFISTTACGKCIETGGRVRDRLGYYMVHELHGGLVVHVHESQIARWRASE